MSIYQKQLIGRVKKTGQKICLNIHFNHDVSAQEDWKGLFDDLLSSLQFFSKKPESIPRHIDLYCGETYDLVLKDTNSHVPDNKEEFLKDDLLTIIEPVMSFTDMVVDEPLKEELEEIIFYCLNKEAVDTEILQNKSRKPGVFINFHGPSGTGKTLAAEILATNLNKTLMVVNYANLESELVGRTSKNIHKIFEIAQRQESLLMFDEADSFLSARITELRQSADYGINTSRSQLLKEMEHYPGVVIFATNNIKNYDYAFQRRFQYNLNFPLPNLEARREILYLYCFSKKISPTIDWDEIAERLEGFSGGDISNMVRRAVVRGMQELLEDQTTAIDKQHFLYAIKCVKQSRASFRKRVHKASEFPLTPIPATSELETGAHLLGDTSQTNQ